MEHWRRERPRESGLRTFARKRSRTVDDENSPMQPCRVPTTPCAAKTPGALPPASAPEKRKFDSASLRPSLAKRRVVGTLKLPGGKRTNQTLHDYFKDVDAYPLEVELSSHHRTNATEKLVGRVPPPSSSKTTDDIIVGPVPTPCCTKAAEELVSPVGSFPSPPKTPPPRHGGGTSSHGELWGEAGEEDTPPRSDELEPAARGVMRAPLVMRAPWSGQRMGDNNEEGRASSCRRDGAAGRERASPAAGVRGGPDGKVRVETARVHSGSAPQRSLNVLEQLLLSAQRKEEEEKQLWKELPTGHQVVQCEHWHDSRLVELMTLFQAEDSRVGASQMSGAIEWPSLIHLLVKADGSAIAYIWSQLGARCDSCVDEANLPRIHHLYVREACRKAHFGRRLLHWWRSRYALNVETFAVTDPNQGMRRLLQRNGCTHTLERSGFDGSAEHYHGIR